MTERRIAQGIEELHRRVSALEASAGNVSSEQPVTPVELFEELRTSLEELQVAEEELRQQNEELAVTREALEAERLRYRELFECAPDGYLVTDAEGTIREANRAAARLLQVEPRFLVGKPMIAFVVGEAHSAFYGGLTRLRQVGRLPEWEVRLQPRTGAPVDAILTVEVVADREGRPSGLRWLVRDFSQRKRMEADIRRLNVELEGRVQERTRELEGAHERTEELLSREQAARTDAESAQRRFAFLAEASRLLAASLDYETTLASVTRLAVPRLADWCAVDLVEEEPSARRVAATHLDPATEAQARELERRYPHQPDAPYGVRKVLRNGQSEFHPSISDALLAEAARDLEQLRLLRELGVQSYMCVPLVARGRTVGALTLVRMSPERRYSRDDLTLAEDLARRAALAVDNARLYYEAQKANEAKEHFLAILSHELRTPLTPIQGSVELLRRVAEDPQRVRQAADVVERNVRLQTSLVNDLLDLSRITRGKLSLDRQPTGLGELIDQTLDGLRAEMEGAGLTLTWERPAEEICAEVDPFRIQQVLLNLVGNAIKYTPPGGRICLSLERTGDFARMTVEDTGIGISHEALPQIFEMFHQEEGAGLRQGLGIGLALVLSLVRLHEGHVWAESDGLGRGSRFMVELPAVDEKVRGREGESVGDSSLRVPTTPQPFVPSSPSVLIVEDNADSRETMREVLELLGYEVREAASADAALALLAGWHPDAILSDIGLPGTDGCELMRRVRQMPAQADVVAVAITGYGTREDREHALSAGFNAHVPKPLDLLALDRQIRELLAARGEAAPVNPLPPTLPAPGDGRSHSVPGAR
jgi:PAS domain S-box-containing protein